MRAAQVIPDQAWTVWDLLTPQECQELIEAATDAGIQTASAPGDVRLRDCLRVELDNEELADRIWNRVQNIVPHEIVVTDDLEMEASLGVLHPRERVGRWRSYGVNKHFRICCYPGQDHFAPHRDADYVVDEHHVSMLTINGYLTERPLGFGGATRFLMDDIPVFEQGGKFSTPDDAVLHRIEADCAGKAIVFRHGLMHDGELLKQGSPPKWLFRTEIMFERDEASAPQLSADQREARLLVQQAETAETRGDIADAIKLYSGAYRLDPSLE